MHTEVIEAPADHRPDARPHSRPAAAIPATRSMHNLLAVLAEDQAPRGPGPLAPRGRPSTGLAPWQILRVREYVETELAGAIQVACLARIAKLSASHFARAFKASLGLTPASYVMVRRIERAKRMMLDSNAPLCLISLDCGFTDQSHLSRVFRRRVGSSPSKWRRWHRVD